MTIPPQHRPSILRLVRQAKLRAYCQKEPRQTATARRKREKGKPVRP